MDLYSTILDHAGITVTDAERKLPSRNLMPVLKGDMPTDWGDDAVYSEQEETRVIRTQKWVLFKRFDGPTNQGIGDELYDVEKDPQETNNLSGNEKYKAVEDELGVMLLDFFRQHVRAEADLWTGGNPIQNSMRTSFWKDAWGEQWAPVYAYEKLV